MTRSILALCLITSHLGLSTICQARPIDDFSVGPVELFLDSETLGNAAVQTGLAESHVAGGIRRAGAAFSTRVAPGTEARILVDTTAETLTFETMAPIEGFGVVYGFGGPDFQLDLDLSEYSGFRIDVVSYTGPTLEAGFVFSSGNFAPGRRGGADILTIVESAQPASFYIPFAPFTAQDHPNPVDFSDIDSIRLSGKLAPGSRLVLGGIFAVPEPAPAVLLMSALFVLAGRRY